MDHTQSFGANDPGQTGQYGIMQVQIPQQLQSQEHQQQLPQHVHQRQPSFTRWAAQPITAYQLVPMDGGGCGGYPPFGQQNQNHHQQGHQQQPTIFTFPQMSPMQSMQTMPPMSPMTPLTPVGNSISPIRRQPSMSFSISSGNFYQPSTPMYQQFQGGPVQHQQQQAQHQLYHLQPPSQHHQQQHQLQRSQSIPVLPSNVLPSGSPEAPRAFHLSPIRRAPQPYSPNMVFASAAPAVQQAQVQQVQPIGQPVGHTHHQSLENQDVFVDSFAQKLNLGAAPAPSTSTNLATRHASSSFVNHRTNKPKPLTLDTSHLQPRIDLHNGDNGDADYFRSASHLAAYRRKSVGAASTIPASVPGPVYIPSVTPVGSDRDYDAGGSSYSTSPLASEAQARIRARMRMPSKAEADGGAPVAPVGGPVNPPLLAPIPKTPRESLDNSLEQFLQDHIHTIEANYADDKDDDDSGHGHVLSDEWYTTSDTDPIRARHRHRVVETVAQTHAKTGDDESAGDSVGVCDCGMQQCSQCGLFISRPETHTCIGVVSNDDC